MDPIGLNRWVSSMKTANDIVQLTTVFCASAWLAPHIPDHAAIGSYAKSNQARIYKRAAEQMPRLLLVATFGDEQVTQNLQYFMRQLEQAEGNLDKNDLRLVSNVTGKDRGPFLYWLLNESAMRVESHSPHRLATCTHYTQSLLIRSVGTTRLV